MAPRTDLLVVSHACVLATNRAVYAQLARDGARVELVVPARWRDAFHPAGYVAEPPAALEGHVHAVGVLGVGRPQRHVYRTRAASLLGRFDPAVVLVEEEPFSLAARQWARAARRAGIPFGVQVAETLDRPLPAVVARSRDAVVHDAAFVAARSPRAAALAARWGARGAVAVVPHDVALGDPAPSHDGPFTIAYLGRLVEEKGVTDLLDAAAHLDARLLVAGAGPLADAVAAAEGDVALLGPVGHDRVGAVYARADVTCVPSRTTPRWEEQFGRVAVESLAHGVPVVATATGALPWVLGRTGGGVLVGERDPAALAAALARLAEDRAAARALGAAGRDGVRAAFSTEAVAQDLAALLAGVRR